VVTGASTAFEAVLSRGISEEVTTIFGGGAHSAEVKVSVRKTPFPHALVIKLVGMAPRNPTPQKENHRFCGGFRGALGRTRTCGLLIRSQ
jgi:hypothetical protein